MDENFLEYGSNLTDLRQWYLFWVYTHHDSLERIIHHGDQHVQSHYYSANHVSHQEKTTKCGGESKHWVFYLNFVFFYEAKQQPE